MTSGSGADGATALAGLPELGSAGAQWLQGAGPISRKRRSAPLSCSTVSAGRGRTPSCAQAHSATPLSAASSSQSSSLRSSPRPRAAAPASANRFVPIVTSECSNAWRFQSVGRRLTAHAPAARQPDRARNAFALLNPDARLPAAAGVALSQVADHGSRFEHAPAV